MNNHSLILMCSSMITQGPSPQTMSKTSHKTILIMTNSSGKLYFEKNFTQRGWVWEKAWAKSLSSSRWPYGNLQKALSVWWRRYIENSHVLWSIYILERKEKEHRKDSSIQGKKEKGCVSLASIQCPLYSVNKVFLCMN